MRNTRGVTVLYVTLLFVAGVIFRLWFIQLSPQPFLSDQKEYDTFASRIYRSPSLMGSHSYRTYPYPLFIALIYKTVGFGNHRAVYRVQALLDSFTGVLLYLVIRYGFGNKSTALLGQFLYTINPFTAGYVGVILSEVLSTFFIMATIATGIFYITTRRVLWAFALGMSAGLSAETRNAALLWAAIPMGLTLFWLPIRKYRFAIVAMIVGFLLTLLYPLVNNKRAYGQWSVTTVDSFYAKEFYNGAVLRTLPPFTVYFPESVERMFYEYYSEWYPGRTPLARRQMAAKYYQKAWDIIRQDPVDYLVVRLWKMWYMWQKENIFFYKEPGFTSHWQYTYIGNLVLLTCALWGIIVIHKRKIKSVTQWAYATMVGSLIYATIVFSFSHAEYRITIPFYPIIIGFAAIGITAFHQKIIQTSP